MKNELIVKLGAEEILLRPTFENVAELESNVGALGVIAMRCSKGAPMSVSAQVIYYCQAARDPEDSTKRLRSLEEVWSLVQDQGIKSIVPVMEFLTNITAGNKLAPELTEKQKKS
jgi:hypothetical protein